MWYYFCLCFSLQQEPMALISHSVKNAGILYRFIVQLYMKLTKKIILANCNPEQSMKALTKYFHSILGNTEKTFL